MEEQLNVTLNDQALIINFPPTIESNEGIKNYKLLMRNGSVGGDPPVKLEIHNEEEEPVTVDEAQYAIFEGEETGDFSQVQGDFPLDLGTLIEEAMTENSSFLDGDEPLTIQFLMEFEGEAESIMFEITAENDFSQAA